jgi:hypothetical protein
MGRAVALRDASSEGAGHQRRRLFDAQIVLIETPLRADLDNISETVGGQQACACAPPFDQGVGRQSRAMHDQGDLIGRQT